MAITQLNKIVIVVAVLAAAGVLLPLAWISSLPWTPFATSPFSITDVQFEEDYSNISVESTCTEAKIISQVTVRDLKAYGYGFIVDRTSTLYVVGVHEPVPVGEEIFFCLSFKWASGRAYKIELEPADKGWGTALYVVAP